MESLYELDAGREADERELQQALRQYGLLKEELDYFIKTRDQLADRQAKTRRNLLITGLLALVIGRTNLVPSKIDALGISFDSVQQANFRFIVAAVVIYFLFVFTYQKAQQAFYDAVHKVQIRMVGEMRDRIARQVHRYSPRVDFWRNLSNSLGPIVETGIPYILALLGIGSVFKMLPNAFYLGIL
jgi:hypothetical protein